MSLTIRSRQATLSTCKNFPMKPSMLKNTLGTKYLSIGEAILDVFGPQTFGLAVVNLSEMPRYASDLNGNTVSQCTQESLSFTLQTSVEVGGGQQERA